MEGIHLIMMKREPIDTYGYNFVEEEFLEEGRDEYTLRNEQIKHWNASWRHLKEDEIALLISLGNISSSWSNVLVEDPIDLNLIRNTSFFGLVRIGSLQPATISYHDFKLPEGIRESHIVSCDINRHCALYKVAYLSHYQIDTMCMLHRIDEMDTTNHSKAGVGVIKDGEDEEIRVKIGIMNENGNRGIHPFVSMRTSDAMLWGTYREYPVLQKRLIEFTDQTSSSFRGSYGHVEHNTVIKSCRIIKDVNIGSHAYIKGANKLKNLTILSDENASSQIGEGVELVNGIIGYQCRVFYGVKAVCFILGNNSNLKYGARLLHSYLGDNSTVSCCEVLNSLVFPFHEQHHNNSFLIAALIGGQSNMAAGANIGSNHNTRGADGELQAKRGFWPALSSSLKYNCSFASFTLITKGSYPNELNLRIPFTMVSYNEAKRTLNVMPAYWWMYNRYALERNGWKFSTRDKRYYKSQHIDSEYLSIDTMDEILNALDYLGLIVGRNMSKEEQSEEVLIKFGRKLLDENSPLLENREFVTYDIERSKRATRVLKIREGYRGYREMLIFGCMRIILKFANKNNQNLEQFASSVDELLAEKNSFFNDAIDSPVVNLGGHLVSESLVKRLIQKIENHQINSWDEVHEMYDQWWSKADSIKSVKALMTLKTLFSGQLIDFNLLLVQFKELAFENARQIEITRKKDFLQPFRDSVYRNEEEKRVILGTIETDSFVKRSNEEMKILIDLASHFPC